MSILALPFIVFAMFGLLVLLDDILGWLKGE
jgi:hypothetical protein